MNARFVLVMGPADLAPLKSKIAGFGRGGLGYVHPSEQTFLWGKNVFLLTDLFILINLQMLS